MTLTVVQYQTGYFTVAPYMDVVCAPFTAGNLVLVLGGGAGRTLTDVKFDARAQTPESSNAHANGSPPVWSFVNVYQAAGGETYVRGTVNSGVGPWAFGVIELAGEAHIPPYVSDPTYGTGDAVTEPSFTAANQPDLGFLFATLIGGDGNTPQLPAGWTTLFGSSYWPYLGIAWGYRAIGARGAQSPETCTGWIPGSGVAWEADLLGTYEPGLRLRSGVAIAACPTALLPMPGTVEPPSSVFPIEPDPHPMPEDPQPIVVPQPQWIPTPGQPYRRSDQ